MSNYLDSDSAPAGACWAHGRLSRLLGTIVTGFGMNLTAAADEPMLRVRCSC